MTMQGILLIDKPTGWTSFDVVNYVRRIVATQAGTKPKNTKVGHTGTLDPAATGLLVLLVGKEYTRKATELAKVDKTYEVTMKLGETSSTGDSEGEIEAVSDTAPEQKAVLEAVERFRGQLMQTPPIYSAIKINGQRAYKLAREGKVVEMEPRPVTIYSSELTSYEYPFVKFTCKVSSGTYIRRGLRERAGDGGVYVGFAAYCSRRLRHIERPPCKIIGPGHLAGQTFRAVANLVPYLDADKENNLSHRLR
jgi:tRNA pseudouridine55 synthase